jgi:hypothetical protein
LEMACSMTLSHTSCISAASCSCHLTKGEEVRVRGRRVAVDEEKAYPGFG